VRLMSRLMYCSPGLCILRIGVAEILEVHEEYGSSALPFG
jgi:hypothetical protein